MVVALNEHWQRVGDMAARTVVVDTRRGKDTFVADKSYWYSVSYYRDETMGQGISGTMIDNPENRAGTRPAPTFP